MSIETEVVALRVRVSELEHLVQYLYKQLNFEYVAEPSSVDPRILEVVKKGNKIESIKIYREIYNVGLAEAKSAVESIEAGLGL